MLRQLRRPDGDDLHLGERREVDRGETNWEAGIRT